MKQKILYFFSVVIMCLLVASCVKDAPIYPDDPDFVPYQGKPGSGGSGGTVDETQLPGEWVVSKTYTETYLNGTMQTSMDVGSNFFNGVQLNGATKGYEFDGGVATPSVGSYILSKSGSSLYIQFDGDPFGRASSDKTQITNLTATSMTWVAFDPLLTINSPIGIVQGGWKVVYTRVP